MKLLIISFMVGSEEHFRTTIGPERAAALFDALASSSDRARAVTAREGFTEARTEPVIAFDFAVNGMADLESHPGVRMVTVKNQHFWTIDDIYAIRVKKLGANLRSSNHQSEQQEMISRQAVLPGLEPLIYVTAGTTYSRRTGLAGQSVVVKYCAGPMHKQRVEWFVDPRGTCIWWHGTGRPDPAAAFGTGSPSGGFRKASHRSQARSWDFGGVVEPKLIELARVGAGLTQGQLAKKLGKSQPFVSQVEHGEKDIPSDLIPYWCDACDVPESFLLRAGCHSTIRFRRWFTEG